MTMPAAESVAAGGLPDGPPERARIGVIAPYDLALDDELLRWVPAGVSLHLTRTPLLAEPVGVEQAERLTDHDQIRRCVADLKAIEPAGYAYACTSASFVHGLAGERALTTLMERTGGAPAVTTSGALLAALAALDVRSVAVAAPYDVETTDRLVCFLAEARISVVGKGFLDLRERIWEVSYRVTGKLVRTLPRAGAEAIVLSCTNLSSYDLIGPLEAELGMPVISANQATVWAALRLIGRRAVGAGQTLIERT